MGFGPRTRSQIQKKTKFVHVVTDDLGKLWPNSPQNKEIVTKEHDTVLRIERQEVEVEIGSIWSRCPEDMELKFALRCT